MMKHGSQIVRAEENQVEPWWAQRKTNSRHQKKTSEYDQEIPQSHTADQPTAP